MGHHTEAVDPRGRASSSRLERGLHVAEGASLIFEELILYDPGPRSALHAERGRPASRRLVCVLRLSPPQISAPRGG